MRLRNLPSLHSLAALLVAVAIGCTNTPDEVTSADPDAAAGGMGGSGEHVGGAGGAGGGEDPDLLCDCSLAARGCGALLAELATLSGCEIPLLPAHEADLLTCVDGAWGVEATCADGCEAGADEGADACVETMPTIRMDRLVVQAQVEPFRGDQPSLPGNFAVERVQEALLDEGFAVTVDGWFGNQTADRYADWQKQLGYSGLGANGIPGPASLTALGEGRFYITKKITVGPQTTFTGRTVNQRTKTMLEEAQQLLGFAIVLTQGSYNAGGVSASAGTHDGGGAVDVSVSNLTTTQRWKTVEAMRKVGFAAWLRTPSQGNWPYHIHAIAVGDTDLSISARNQVADYFVGKNGLASHADDNTPAGYQVPFTWWEEYVSQ